MYYSAPCDVQFQSEYYSGLKQRDKESVQFVPGKRNRHSMCCKLPTIIVIYQFTAGVDWGWERNRQYMSFNGNHEY